MYAWAIRNRERFATALAASSWAAPMAAFAQLRGEVTTPSGVAETGFKDFEDTIRLAFNIVITVAGVAFVVLFLLGGVQYLTAAGNEDSTKKARQLMLDAAIGLVIVVTAWAVGTYVLRLLGVSERGELDTLPVGR